jgi:hypothetical protein
MMDDERELQQDDSEGKITALEINSDGESVPPHFTDDDKLRIAAREGDTPSAETAQTERQQPHKMFFDPNLDAREIARIIWASRDKDAFK